MRQNCLFYATHESYLTLNITHRQIITLMTRGNFLNHFQWRHLWITPSISLIKCGCGIVAAAPLFIYYLCVCVFIYMCVCMYDYERTYTLAFLHRCVYICVCVCRVDMHEYVRMCDRNSGSNLRERFEHKRYSLLRKKRK